MRDATVVLGVEFVVGVKQIKLDTTYVGHPQCSVYHEVGIGHIHNQLVAVLIQYALDGEIFKVLRFVVGNLLAVH